MFFKWFFKAFVAVFIVTHTFDITMAVFDMAQHIVSGAAGVIGGSTSIDVAAALSSMQAGLDAMEIPELLLLMLETSLVSLCMKIMSVLITVVLYGRMIEIYLYCSVSPIPFATMTNREWGQIGNNYLKGLFALGFQGFLIMICVGIYAVLVNNMVIADNLHTAIFSIAAYTVLLYQAEDRRRCAECGAAFASTSNSVKYCPDCRKRITRRQAAERMRKRRARVTQ